MLKYTRFAVACLSPGYSGLMQLWHICTCFYSFAIEVIEQGGVKFSVRNIRSLWSNCERSRFLLTDKEQRKDTVLVGYLLQWSISMCKLDIHISVYMCMERREERKEGRHLTWLQDKLVSVNALWQNILYSVLMPPYWFHFTVPCKYNLFSSLLVSN